ncbi:putative methionine gamma-lyase [Haematococcus lacustris]
MAANLRKVQAAFREQRIGPHHFQGSTGYGHGDWGREALDKVMARVMGAEAALMRIQFISGTHAIATALFSVLRPQDEMLAIAGHPYDTMEEVIGLRGKKGVGSLMDWGIQYRELPLAASGSIDWEALASEVVPGKTRVAHIQRSCGYALRPTLSIAEIERAIKLIRAQDPSVVITVDNCYGEFTEELEPCAVGADLCMGSLIKNAGGTIAPGGGYVAGRADLIDAVSARLSAPGIGTDAGGVRGTTMRLLFQGLFLAPTTTGEALKGGRLVAEVMSREGYKVIPAPGLPTTHSMITAIEVGSRDSMTAFCKGVQKLSPVGSYIEPEPGVTAGYGDEVIFADGTFIDGSTAEVSADGPMRPPYVVYCQGGTHWTHWAIALESALTALRAADAAQGQPKAQQQQPTQ